MNRWGSAVVIRGCKRCKGPFKAYRTSHEAYCSTGCLAFDYEERRQKRLDAEADTRARNTWTRQQKINNTPLHILYPGMMAVASWAQERRPSYERWAK